jgi:hypothetical protein
MAAVGGAAPHPRGGITKGERAAEAWEAGPEVSISSRGGGPLAVAQQRPTGCKVEADRRRRCNRTERS